MAKRPNKKPAKQAKAKPSSSVRAKMLKIFKEDYEEAWATKFEESPHARAEILELIFVELQLEICQKEFDRLMETGEGLTYIAPNGVMGDHPILKRQDKLRKQQKDLVASLNLSLARRDRNKKKINRFSELSTKK